MSFQKSNKDLFYYEHRMKPDNHKNDKNVSKTSISKKQKKKKKNRFKKFILIFFILIFSIMLVVGGIFYIKFYPKFVKCKEEADKISANISENDFKKNSTSYVFDSAGNEMFDIKSDKNLEYLEYDNIPSDVKQAFIAVEDKRFMSHSGIDIQSLMRAAYSYVKHDGTITQGGSTITQQLVKLTYLSSEQNAERKIKEILISLEMEKKFSKEQILEFYINNVYFNNNAYGINAAANTYFHKSVSALTMPEITFLCAIPNNPSYFDPYTNKQHTIERQHVILKDMLAEGYITQDQYDKALATEINVLSPLEDNNSYDSRKDFVIKDVCEILMKQDNFNFQYSFNSYSDKEQYNKSYDEAYSSALRKLYSGGYNIYTSLDTIMQYKVQKIIDDSLADNTSTNENGIYNLQASSVTVDNKTGLIKTIIGGRTSKNKDYLNRAYNSFRQNGSTMKPIGVYTPAFDILGYTPNTIKNDSQVAGGPKNSCGYYGDITLRKAITISSNTVASKLYNEVTPQKGMAYLQAMQFQNIVPDDMRAPSGLGGLTIGTNTKEMAAAYATIENKGKFNPASCVVKIEQIRNKKVLYEHSVLDKQIYKESSAALVRDMMKDVIKYGTAKGNELENNIECAGKTGTTNDNRDGWFVGFSPVYTTSIWVGYDTPKTIESLYGNIVPSSIWKKIMDSYHRNDKDLQFEKSDSVKEIWINDNGEEVPEGQGTKELYPIEKLPNKNSESFKEQYKEKINEVCDDSDISKESNIDKLSDSLKPIKDEIDNSDLTSDVKKSLDIFITNKIIQAKDSLVTNIKSQVNISSTTNDDTIINDEASNNTIIGENNQANLNNPIIKSQTSKDKIQTIK